MRVSQNKSLHERLNREQPNLAPVNPLQNLPLLQQEAVLDAAMQAVCQDPLKYTGRRNQAIETELKKVQRKTRVMRSKVVSLSALCTYDSKLKRLIDVLDEVVAVKSQDLDLLSKKARAVVAVIAELNKMQGHYAPEKHMILNANLTPEQSDKMNSLISQYAEEY